MADPKILKGGGADDNLSAPSSFVANAHNEIYDFYTEKAAFGGKCEPIGELAAPTAHSPWILHCTSPHSEGRCGSTADNVFSAWRRSRVIYPAISALMYDRINSYRISDASTWTLFTRRCGVWWQISFEDAWPGADRPRWTAREDRWTVSAGGASGTDRSHVVPSTDRLTTEACRSTCPTSARSAGTAYALADWLKKRHDDLSTFSDLHKLAAGSREPLFNKAKKQVYSVTWYVELHPPLESVLIFNGFIRGKRPNSGVSFRLRNDLYCVEWGVKLYSLTQGLADPVTRFSWTPD